MALRVVQEQQCPAAQDLARAPNQAAGDQVVGVDGFLVPIQIEGGRWVAGLLWLHRPESSCSMRQCIRECLVAPGARYLGEKALAVEVAIRSSPSGQERQCLARIAPQVPTASQSDHSEEQQGQERLAAGRRGGPCEPRSRLFASREHLLQGRDHARLVSSGEQEQTPSSLTPGRLKGRPGRLIFPPRPTPGV